MPTLSPVLEFFIQIGLLFILPWVVYIDALCGKCVSDDWAGLEFTDESRAQLYKGELFKPVSFHTLLRYFRWHTGKAPNPEHDWKRKGQLPSLSSQTKHHRLNIILFSGVTCLLYLFLAKLTDPWTAFFAVALFAVHPFGTQTVAWVSGIGYLLAMIFLLIALNVLSILPWGWWACPSVLCFSGLVFLSVQAMFSASGIVFLLLFLKHGWFALGAALAVVLAARGTLKRAVSHRKEIFMKQGMGDSTRVTWRKVVVATKALTYYTALVFWPKRLGLYHAWGYHYELPYIEHEDWMFWIGVGILLVAGGLIALCPFPVQLGIIWFLSFLLLFLNWITVNQFVTERYCWIPSAGMCLAVSWVVLHSPFPGLYGVLFGLALMRTWAHIPTYYDEEWFYFSNLLNFPQSEVAWGNLGVNSMQNGRLGNAIDYWLRGTQINPDYDVNWYNIASLLRARGPYNPNYLPRLFELMPENFRQLCMNRADLIHLITAKFCLDKASSGRFCHFPDKWIQEREELDAILRVAIQPPPPSDFRRLPGWLF